MTANPKPEPGLYNMSFEEYAQIQAVNNSRLVAYNKTPAHALVYKPDTQAMRIGRAAHAMLLEPSLYAKKWAVMPDGMIRRGKKWEEWSAENEGKEILSLSEEESIKGIVKSLSSGEYDTARKLIELCGNDTEVVLVWKHPKFGCLCKCRLDGFALREFNLIIDLKTTTDSDPDDWIRTAINAKGQPHWQVMHYLQGAQSVLSPEIKTFLWIVMEVKEPFGISVIQAAPAPTGESDMVYLAKLQMEPVLERYLQSERTGKFPGRPDKVIPGRLPQWFINKQ